MCCFYWIPTAYRVILGCRTDLFWLLARSVALPRATMAQVSPADLKSLPNLPGYTFPEWLGIGVCMRFRPVPSPFWPPERGDSLRIRRFKLDSQVQGQLSKGQLMEPGERSADRAEGGLLT